MVGKKFSLGTPMRTDVLIASMKAKPEENKTQTSILPGDLLKVIKDNTEGTCVEKVSAKEDCIYGVATSGIHGFTVPVVTQGHVLADIPTTTFADAAEGKKISNSCCCILLISKTKALKEDGTETDAWEIKL